MNSKKITILVCIVIVLWQSAANVSTQTADDCDNRQILKDTDTPRFALLVGIKEYKHRENPPVPGAENDVKLMKDVLVENYNFPDDEKHIVALKTSEAKRGRILTEFQNFLIANAKTNQAKNPIIIFYFSGHGTQYANQVDDTLDGDALDGLDEAIVPFDSRDAGVFDILDDEIDDLSAELAKYSSNILFIFDSCHSGTVSRGKLARETKPNPLNSARKSYIRKFPPTDADEARRKKIVTLAAALPHQSAYPKMDLSGGLMTFHLVAALRRASRNTTYQELMREVRAGVRSENSEQQPFADGDENRFVLAESSNRRDPSIEISADPEDGKIKFRAGRIHGVQPGTQVAIYDKCATKFVGDESFLTYANVLEVGERESIAVLPDEKTNPKIKSVKKDSRLVLTAPTFGGNPISLLLDDTSLSKGEAATTDIRAEIHKILDAPNNELKTNQLVELTDATVQKTSKEKEPGAVLRLRGGKFGEVFPDTNRLRLTETCFDKDRLFPPADTKIYYLQSGFGKDDKAAAPLFGHYFLAENPVAAAEKIIETVGVYTRQRNLINLENKNSSLNDRIELTLKTSAVSLSPSCPTAGKVPIDRIADRCNCADGKSAAITENNQIPQNAAFQIEIKNISNPKQDSKLYVAAFLVSGDGKIKLVGSNDVSKTELTKEKPFLIGFFATQPAGAEMLKVIITTKPDDLKGLEWLETNKTGERSGGDSLLGQLLNQSGYKTRGNPNLAPDSPNSWGVKTIEWTVAETKFTCACLPKKN